MFYTCISYVNNSKLEFVLFWFVLVNTIIILLNVYNGLASEWIWISYDFLTSLIYEIIEIETKINFS